MDPSQINKIQNSEQQRQRSRQKREPIHHQNNHHNKALEQLKKNKQQKHQIIEQKVDDRCERQNKQNQEAQDDIDMFAQDQLAQDLLKGVKNVQAEVTDESGYYNVIVGTVLNKKYRIIQKLGRGVFGVVVKCQIVDEDEMNKGQLQVGKEKQEIKAHQIQQNREEKLFAVKILRKNQLTERSGQRQYKILQKIHNPNSFVIAQKHVNNRDAKNIKKIKRIMKTYDYFMESGHLCLVCQLLSTDLRTYIHKKQPTLDDIRLFAISMFLISHQLRISKVIHADIKPDNFMFKNPPIFPQEKDNEKDTAANKIGEKMIVDNLRLVDFGTSFWVDEHSSQVEYQVARYYRAPEIILGTQVKPYQTYAIDVWAIACTLYEIYTGQFLFNGSSNNQMLKQMMETKGKFSMKMLNKSFFVEKHFDSDHNFLYHCLDQVTKQPKIQKMQVNITGQRDLMNMLKKSHRKMQGEDQKKLQNFRDFLERALALNPKDRLTPQQAMQHPFLHYQVKLE